MPCVSAIKTSGCDPLHGGAYNRKGGGGDVPEDPDHIAKNRGINLRFFLAIFRCSPILR